MLFPFHDLIMLGFESSSVINKRMAKIARGGAQSADEIGLMFSEKAKASQEAMVALMKGGTTAEMIARFREHVAANEVRLSAV
jgi:hypothetical protein